MKTLQQLREENRMLKERRKQTSKFFKNKTEEQKLRRENIALKYPGTARALSTIKKAGGHGIRSLGRGVEGFTRKQYGIGAEQREKQLKNDRKMMEKRLRRKILKDVRVKSLKKKKR